MHKILIVDDEPALRQTLAAILKRSGYEPVMVGSCKEGMQKLREERFSLMFLDIKLPDGMGVDLLPEIYEADPDLPVIILTAHATLEAAMLAVRGGARDFLLKPIDPPAILDRVEKILDENKEPQRQKQILSQVQGLLAELTTTTNVVSTTPATAVPESTDAEEGRFISSGAIAADLYTRHLLIGNEAIALPSSSFDFLVTLIRHSPETVTFEDLVKESQGYECTRIEARDITRWHIHKIRKVIEKDTSDPHHLITVRDIGYRLIG
ncbi:MAG: response regulator transcription factor [Anaerolineaceae bacterium]|nr:response regulator transcription factor [Anaerolineaceae bacterium]MDD4043614.1 response regulator transcription factor [Anaerolineaceae bacterium]MDD4577263.1 response regulator transcription factor [Anaerolineaceae bacterium]